MPLPVSEVKFPVWFTQILFSLDARNFFLILQASQKSLGTTKKELWDRCDFTMKQLDLMTLEMKQKITAITEDVEYKVGKAMSEEIRRLSILVDEFNDPFHPDTLVLNVYKSRLNHHIGKKHALIDKIN